MEEKKQHFDIQTYIHMFLRRKWFIIVPLVVIYTLALVCSFFLPKVYEAKAVVIIEEKKTENPLLKNLSASATVVQKLNALKEEILSWPRLFQLVDRLGLDEGITDPIAMERLISGMRKDIVLKMKSKEVMIITYRGKNPRKTQKLVNTLCDVLGQRTVLSQLQDTESAIDFVNDQLIIYKKKLNKAEASLREFREVYNPPGTQGTLTAGAAQGAGVSLSTGAALNKITTNLSELEAQLVMTSIDCTDEHPRIKDLKRRIRTLKKERNQYIQRLAKKSGLDPKAFLNISDSIPRQQEELTRLTRDKAINEKVYAMFLERLESAKITERLDSSENKTKFRVVEPARLPLVPIKPNKAQINLLGLFLGLGVGFGLAYLMEFLDSSFKNVEQLKEHFGSPVLGSVSKIVTEEDLKNKALSKKKLYKATGAAVLVAAIVTVIVVKIGF